MEKNAIVIDSQSQIRKPKSLIFGRLKENLPISANRLWYAILAEIAKRPQDDDGTSFIINGKDIAKLAGINANIAGIQLEEIYKNSTKLAGYTIEMIENDGNPVIYSLLSSVKYFSRSRAIRVNIDPNLLKYLKEYVNQISVSYTLGGPMKFKCIYTPPLFDIMNYYLSQKEVEFTVQEIRNLMHVPEGKLTTITNLNSRAVYPAVREICQHTNLNVTCELIKNGRTAKGYKFVIEEKEDNFLEIENPEERKIFNFIQKIISAPYSLSKNLVFELLDKFGADSCIINFEYTKKQKYNNFTKYYRYCLNNKIGEIELEKAQIREADYKKYKDIEPIQIENTPPQIDLIKENPDIPNLEIKERTEEERAAYNEEMRKTNPELYAIMQKFNEAKAKKNSKR